MVSKVQPLGLEFDATGATGALKGDLSNTRHPSIARDIRLHGAVSGNAASITAGVAAAVADGYTYILIPAGFTYIPPLDGSSRRATPADVTIVGENWQTSIVSVSNRATEENVYIGARGRLMNVGIIAKFQDREANPQATEKVAPVRDASNAGDDPQAVTNWTFAALALSSGPTVTGPGGVVASDIPLISLTGKGAGSDNTYSSADASGVSAHRVVTTVSNAIGIFGFHGLSTLSPSLTGHFSWTKAFLDYGTGSQGTSTRRTDRIGTAVSDFINDLDSLTTNSNPWSEELITKQSSGPIHNVYGGGTAYSGSYLALNLGNGASFTGRFLDFSTAGALKFAVDYTGGVLMDSLLMTGGVTVIDSNRNIRLRTYTYATLPTPTGGLRAVISDGPASPTFNAAASGGGSTQVTVTGDGAIWRFG